jgi:uncharacterized damage-inducible protein DinB
MLYLFVNLFSRINNDGIGRTTTAKDVLIHVFTEELHHRGEIIPILWQGNIQPSVLPNINSYYSQIVLFLIHLA